jgi:hypothetical protein
VIKKESERRQQLERKNRREESAEAPFQSEERLVLQRYIIFL